MPRFELTIPPNTPANAPISQVIKVGQESFNHQVVLIPKGHAYLAFLQITAGRGTRVVPSNDSNVDWLRGNNDRVEYNQHIQLDPPQYVIEVRGYNLDDTYPHTFYIDLE